MNFDYPLQNNHIAVNLNADFIKGEKIDQGPVNTTSRIDSVHSIKGPTMLEQMFLDNSFIFLEDKISGYSALSVEFRNEMPDSNSPFQNNVSYLNDVSIHFMSENEIDKKESIPRDIFPAMRAPSNMKKDTVPRNTQKKQKEANLTKRELPIFPKDKTNCGCKNSKCLRLHCKCFKVLGYCTDTCGCTNCLNTPKFEDARSFVIKKTLEISKHAFKNKVICIKESPNKIINSHGCRCKSGCKNNYCECFKLGAGCSPMCRCASCQNEKIQLLKEEVIQLYALKRRKKDKIVISEGNQNSQTKMSPNPSIFWSDTKQTPLSEVQRQENSKEQIRISFENYKRVKLASVSICNDGL
jgi:hypothetical protein